MIVLILQQINSLWEQHISRIKKEFPGITITRDTRYLGDSEVIISSMVNKKTLEKAESLKAVLVPMTGADQLPLEYMASRGIRVGNVHGNAESVAERAVALLLAWYGKIISYHQDLKRNHWHAFWLGKGVDDTWESITGKTCVILGTGAIGIETAKRLKAFSLTIVGYKKSPVEVVPDGFDEIVYDIDEALDKGEIIISALPSSPETIGMIGKDRLSRMAGKVLVNVGRGEVFEEEALFTALKSGTLRGAALDCWYNYPKKQKDAAPSRYPFGELPNVIMSPHVAGFTQDSVEKSIGQTFANLRSFLEQGTLLYEVNAVKGY